MANVLFVKANDRPADQSVSVRMYESFLNTYRETHLLDRITELDLYQAELPYYGNKMITGLNKIDQGMEASPEEAAAAAVANRYLDQFLAADKIIFAFPLWNLTVPAPLITYIAYLTQPGKTFRFASEGAVGLAGDKKVVLLSARGGDYSMAHMQSLEMALNYVKCAIGLWGIQSPESIVIEGHNQYQDRAQAIIESGLARTVELASGF
ncbi:FMN-dependent NADH-azoreductase [Paenibacillus sepulcri]|uniref:FMN dependent NADH:quinone oxidoreductase n=1 Tax=Paenibacillus sepulcri TaxID=359917 RepID=A0ABS7CGA1_9BACL|nr:FMN-dependent NADH-azoreductase [Paenibacillus sepulcri]